MDSSRRRRIWQVIAGSQAEWRLIGQGGWSVFLFNKRLPFETVKVVLMIVERVACSGSTGILVKLREEAGRERGGLFAAVAIRSVYFMVV